MWSKVILLLFITCPLIYIFRRIIIIKLNMMWYHVKFFVYYFYCILVAIILCPYLFLHRSNPSNNVLCLSSYIKLATKLYGIEWHIRNGEILADSGGAVIISNHQTSLDVLGMCHIWDVVKNMTAIVKKELLYAGPFGLALYLSGMLFVDRKKSKDAYKVLSVTTEIMTKNKKKIWVFPEGTRNRGSELLPFKKGAFNIAVTGQMPIIPIIISPYYFLDPKKYIFHNNGHIILQCLEPVPTVGLTMEDVPELANRLHKIMSDAYEKISKTVLSNLPAE